MHCPLPILQCVPPPVQAAQPRPAGRDVPRVLSIAGSDPSGGAGIQADLKSIAAHGGYGMAAITALTAQNTRGVSAVHVPPAAFLTQQLEAISDDISIDAVKIGMLGDAAVIAAVRGWLEKVRPAVVVLDPVMVATSGDRLLQESAEAALRELLPSPDLITPNLAELAMLLGEPGAGELGRGPGNRASGSPQPPGHRPGQGRAPRRGMTAARTRWSIPGGLLSREVVVVPGERVATRGTATAPAAPCPRPWQQSSRGWGTGKPPSARSSPGCRRAGNLRPAGRGDGQRPVHHFHHLAARKAGRAFAGQLRCARKRRADLEAIYALDFIRDLAAGACRRTVRLLPRPGRHLPQRLFTGAGPRQRHRPHRGRTAVLGPLGPALPGSRVELHRTWLSTRQGQARTGARDQVLRGPPAGGLGVGQLRRAGGSGLPCFWLYAEVGETLHGQFLAAGAPAGHPYADWLRTYADEDFAAATRQAVAIADARGRRGVGDEKAAMAVAFRQSSRYEVDFFDAPRLRLTTDGGRSRYDRWGTVPEVVAAASVLSCGAYHVLPVGTSLICGRRQN